MIFQVENPQKNCKHLLELVILVKATGHKTNTQFDCTIFNYSKENKTLRYKSKKTCTVFVL